MKRSLGTSIILRLWTIHNVLPAVQSALSKESKLAFTTMASSRKTTTNQATTDSQSLQHAQQDSVESKSCTAPWKLYPIESYNELRTKHGKENIKVIHMVRHAEGTHNVERDYKNEKNLDARLTEKGMAQCQTLAQHTQATMMKDLLQQDIDNDVAVITSPMTRCVQTALYSFPWLLADDDDKVPFVALESIRESVNYACDRRRTITEISKEYPRVDFSECCNHDNDFIWDNYRNRLGKDWDVQMESAELNHMAHRAREGLEYLQGRPEHHLIVCSHSGKLTVCVERLLLSVWQDATCLTYPRLSRPMH
mmetsp:Transcript_30556/g.73316  ORF Transcript_30556/g.73316 Transcript_30556/m.73316 type:complete len:309 (+) Transcript_30556:18-944(+)